MTFNVSSKQLFSGLQFALLILIVGLLLWSKPWVSANGQESRKITVTGESTIKAEPDEFMFNPYFELQGSDQEDIKSKLTAQTNETVTKLKELGVEEKDIKLDASSYDRWYLDEGEEGILNAYLQISVRDSELVQKVQDYLLTTPAKGQLTPQASFSESKKKELDNRAVEQAIEDAKSKATLQAKKFDAKVGKVLEVNQKQDSVFPVAYGGRERDATVSVQEATSLPVLSGENEYSQSVTVTYELQ